MERATGVARLAPMRTRPVFENPSFVISPNAVILFVMSLDVSGPDTRPALCMINFNGSGHLAASLGCIHELREQFSEVVLVDDASTDESVEVAGSIMPEARIIRLSRNSGPGAARNAGANALGATRVLFVDNDVVLNPEVLPLLEVALDAFPAAAMALPRVVSASNPEHVEYEGGDAHVSGLISLRTPESEDPVSETGLVGSLITCCFLLDRARWGSDPLFDERLRIYLEDHELGLRARMQGKDLIAVPEAVCLHGPGTPGLSIRDTGHHTPTRIRNTILNRWQVILKLYQRRTLILLAPYLTLFELYQLAGCLVLGWGREWWSAARELTRRRGELGDRRRAFQATRRRGDASVLVAGPHPFNPALSRRLPVRLFHGLLDFVAAANWGLVRGLPGGRANP